MECAGISSKTRTSRYIRGRAKERRYALRKKVIEFMLMPSPDAIQTGAVNAARRRRNTTAPTATNDRPDDDARCLLMGIASKN